MTETGPSATGQTLVITADAWPPSVDADVPLARGESIAAQGCCLTLVDHHAAPGGRATLLRFDVIPETLRKTTLGAWRGGTKVNLERSATPRTLFGGHLVQGHVDAVGTVVRVSMTGEWRVTIAVPPEWRPLLAPQGSIAVDGTSLTVAAIDDGESTFDVCLIPETLARTTLAELGPGSRVNIECDCVAKMVARAVQFQRLPTFTQPGAPPR